MGLAAVPATSNCRNAVVEDGLQHQIRPAMMIVIAPDILLCGSVMVKISESVCASLNSPKSSPPNELNLDLKRVNGIWPFESVAEHNHYYALT